MFHDNGNIGKSFENRPRECLKTARFFAFFEITHLKGLKIVDSM